MEGAGGRKYQVVILRPGQPKLVRMFRRLREAHMWADQQERALKKDAAQVKPSAPE
jgi:hypothetical protein